MSYEEQWGRGTWAVHKARGAKSFTSLVFFLVKLMRKPWRNLSKAGEKLDSHLENIFVIIDCSPFGNQRTLRIISKSITQLPFYSKKALNYKYKYNYL